MRSISLAFLVGLAAHEAAAHATFQDLWIDGVDMIKGRLHGAQCVRLPLSNSPVTDVTSNDIRCNINSGPVGKKCVVKAGSTVTVEMHQQPGDRSCKSEAIGGDHFGPLMVYMSKVADSSTDLGSGSWFKIFQDSWAKNGSGATGDADFWGTKDLNTCCGKMNVKIPSDLPPGDYLLRAEVIALHTAAAPNGAQFYMSCYQLTVTGGSGSATPSGVSFPGAYTASDPGILINIHAPLSTYTAPGPAVYAGGSTKSAGSPCAGCESTCTPGSGPTGTASSVPLPTQTGGGGPSGCSVAKYGQCGGTGYTGCTNCAAGSTCSAVSPPYYSQCV
ncbi:hypothetical protein VTK73DRAFT_1755 [Phialemonium thermophilum]|uniref:lytic cellulose monooxygenase (C4-dehydrogenating) n=1 Tax=Phialemonium thermophilum TaxID=223376 RepID=A0ABR3X7T6_9PEZI